MEGNLIELAGAPGLGLGLAILSRTYNAVENVKVHKQRCKFIIKHCRELLIALQDGSEGLEGERSLLITDEIASIINHVEKKVLEWSNLNYVKSFVSQGDIRSGLDEMCSEIDTAMMKFQFKIQLDMARQNLETRTTQETDKAQFRDLLARIVENVEDVKNLIVMDSSPTRPVVQQVMASLQTELMAHDLQPAHEETFKNGLWMLHEKTQKLPPMTDLSGQVELTAKHPVARGTFNDVYSGIWLGKEKVALRLPRLLPGTRGVHQRFEKDLTIWRKLDHMNVVPLYGIVHFGEADIYSVSPWMDNGTAIEYVINHPNIDRFKIIYQAATGLEYLHHNNIVHGDLRAGNILIDRSGTARLSDFGMSKVLEDCGHGMTTAPGLNPRWYAPELLLQNASSSKETDIWSFGMTCMELLSGRPPFSAIRNDLAVIQELQNGKHPQRPNTPPIPDPFWSLLKKCWEKKPKNRPTAAEVRKQTAILSGMPLPSLVAGSPNQAVPLSHTTSKRRSSLLGFRKSNKKAQDTFPSPGGTEPVFPSLLRVAEPETGYNPNNTISFSGFNGDALPPDGIAPPQLEITFDTDGDEWKLVTETNFNKLRIADNPNTNDYLSPLLSSSPGTSASTSDFLPAPSVPHRSEFTADSSSQYSVTTRSAVTDASIIVNVNKDGIIASGTLEGFVERLIKNFNLPQDLEFRDILLSSTGDFVTSEEFFCIIERRFHEAEHATVHHPQDRIAIQYNILLVIDYWIVTPHLPFDSQLVWQVKNFCENAKSKIRSPMMREKIDKILQSLNQDVRSMSLPPGTIGAALTASEMLPNDLAIGLTLLESDKFKQIYVFDYLSRLGEYPIANAVDVAQEINKKIVIWVQKSTLHFDDVIQRKEVMTFFLHTAKECLQRHNYASAAAISNALNSPAIEALGYTRDQLDQPLKLILTELNQLFDPTYNYLNYRTTISRILINPKNIGIPWLDAHLKDLGNELERHQLIINIHGHNLINFERYTYFRDHLRETLQRFSGATDSLEQYRNQGQLAYVESKLRSIVLDDDILAQLQARADQHRITEKREKRAKTVERRVLGFRDVKKRTARS